MDAGFDKEQQSTRQYSKGHPSDDLTGLLFMSVCSHRLRRWRKMKWTQTPTAGEA